MTHENRRSIFVPNAIFHKQKQKLFSVKRDETVFTTKVAKLQDNASRWRCSIFHYINVLRLLNSSEVFTREPRVPRSRQETLLFLFLLSLSKIDGIGPAARG